jgi:hypothetical protein
MSAAGCGVTGDGSGGGQGGDPLVAITLAAPDPERAACEWACVLGLKVRSARPPPSRTKWTRLVPPFVPIGHVSPLPPY